MSHTLLTRSALYSDSSSGLPVRRARSLTDIASHPSSPREPMPYQITSVIGRGDMDMPELNMPAVPPRARTFNRHSATLSDGYTTRADPLPVLPEEPEPPAPAAVATHRRGGDFLGLPLPRLRRFLAIFGRGQDGTRRRRALMSLLWEVGVGGSAVRHLIFQRSCEMWLNAHAADRGNRVTCYRGPHKESHIPWGY